MNDRRAVHVGIAWQWRYSYHTESVLIHAVVRPEGVRGERLPDGRIGWDRPWIRVCDGGDADERRFGWVVDVTCPRCRSKLGIAEIVDIDLDSWVGGNE